MSNIPKQYKYTSTHEWVHETDDQTMIIGITDFAQSQLGDLVYVDLSQATGHINKGAECAVVESVKTASDIFAPLSGEILEVNTTLINQPELVNQSPYQDGWLIKIKLQDKEEIDQLLDADAYQQLIAE